MAEPIHFHFAFDSSIRFICTAEGSCLAAGPEPVGLTITKKARRVLIAQGSLTVSEPAHKVPAALADIIPIRLFTVAVGKLHACSLRLPHFWSASLPLCPRSSM